MLRAPADRFVLQNARGGTVLATHLESAFDSPSRRRGLLGRTVFETGSALIIAPCGGIHTLFMRMPIDVVFVSRNGEVLKMYSGLRAGRIAFALRAFAAIELPSGTIARLDIRRGDSLLLISG